MDQTQIDKQLWADMKGGDARALEKIYRLHSTSLYRYAAKFTKDEGAIQDCLHDLFCDLWSRRDTIGPTDSIQRYLMVALRRRIIKLQTHQTVWTDDFPLLPDVPGADELELIIPPAQLERAMQELSAREREALYLKYYQGMDYEQMSETMQMQYQSLRNLVHRALLKMRGLLGAVWMVITAIKVFWIFLSTK